MKKSVFFVAFLLISFLVKAQTNLQLNQVLTYNGTIGNNESSPTWKVPNGKIWKIEARTQEYLKINGSYYSGGTVYYYNNGIASNSFMQSLPIWLKSGDSILYKPSNNLSYGMDYFISILEFNLNQQ